ncbi:biotin carboxyl carrier protein of acetyl-CoA carboxylase 1, chloroplastic-like isoform X1 [Macadamia integrifolia]|uniref:biotin carboxyl carrier protein of acetyl-CoA carboxylase 1, chloroplastic-like isoform X1 n=1 Tax=Macadamia integrifolia TaxID=60698 RepID=UPI001C4E3C9B|nr:biotin carboxyl carrier protein of acetyl-CoA carboxylase 1, chloroplastic-like isoform X1 [Macadamia integrifolia]
MASSLPAASATAAASASKTTTSTSSLPYDQRHCCHSRVSFNLSSKPKLLFSTKVQPFTWNHSRVVKAQSNEVAVDGSSNAEEIPATKSDVLASEEKNAKPVKEPSHAALATEESLSEFINQVSNLVKLVDSRDIVELQMKQLDCELVIRKKVALPQPLSPAPMAMMHPSSPSPAIPSAFPPPPPAAAPTAAPTPSTSTPPPSPPPSKVAKSSLPPLKCPMAGTFYRSPGPGEPPFVKVGDKVQKGQVLCIIEAMKLMNEIECSRRRWHSLLCTLGLRNISYAAGRSQPVPVRVPAHTG